MGIEQLSHRNCAKSVGGRDAIVDEACAGGKDAIQMKF